jgi:hypothetical protein
LFASPHHPPPPGHPSAHCCCCQPCPHFCGQSGWWMVPRHGFVCLHGFCSAFLPLCFVLRVCVFLHGSCATCSFRVWGSQGCLEACAPGRTAHRAPPKHETLNPKRRMGRRLSVRPTLLAVCRRACPSMACWLLLWASAFLRVLA